MKRSFTKASIAILIASILGIVGCNRGKDIIDEATGVYLSGDPLRAAEILSRVETEAPNTPEVNEARALAIEWLTRASELERGESRRTYVLAALQWSPSDPDLNSRRCECELDLDNWEAARACLKEVDGKIPGREHQRLTQILADHDKKIANSKERTLLLESDDAISLYRLLAEFPGSDESHRAAERLPELSLCADLKRFSEALFTGGQTGPASWGPRLREQDSPGYQRSVLADIRRSSNELSGILQTLESELREHTIMIDEGPAQEQLLEGYGLLQPEMKRLHASFTGKAYKLEDRIKKIDRFAHRFIETSAQVEERRKAAQQTCEALGR